MNNEMQFQFLLQMVGHLLQDHNARMQIPGIGLRIFNYLLGGKQGGSFSLGYYFNIVIQSNPATNTVNANTPEFIAIVTEVINCAKMIGHDKLDTIIRVIVEGRAASYILSNPQLCGIAQGIPAQGANGGFQTHLNVVQGIKASYDQFLFGMNTGGQNNFYMQPVNGMGLPMNNMGHFNQMQNQAPVQLGTTGIAMANTLQVEGNNAPQSLLHVHDIVAQAGLNNKTSANNTHNTPVNVTLDISKWSPQHSEEPYLLAWCKNTHKSELTVVNKSILQRIGSLSSPESSDITLSTYGNNDNTIKTSDALRPYYERLGYLSNSTTMALFINPEEEEGVTTSMDVLINFTSHDPKFFLGDALESIIKEIRVHKMRRTLQYQQDTTTHMEFPFSFSTGIVIDRHYVLNKVIKEIIDGLNSNTIDELINKLRNITNVPASNTKFNALSPLNKQHLIRLLHLFINRLNAIFNRYLQDNLGLSINVTNIVEDYDDLIKMLEGLKTDKRDYRVALWDYISKIEKNLIFIPNYLIELCPEELIESDEIATEDEIHDNIDINTGIIKFCHLYGILNIELVNAELNIYIPEKGCVALTSEFTPLLYSLVSQYFSYINRVNIEDKVIKLHYHVLVTSDGVTYYINQSGLNRGVFLISRYTPPL